MSGCQVVNGFIVGNLLRLCGKNVPNSRLASNEEGNYHLVMKQFAMENGPFSSMFHLVKTIIVHGYVNLPEGRIYDIYIYPFHILIICPHGWFSPSKISQMCLFIMFKASLFPSMMTFHGTRIWASDSWEQKHSCPIYQPPKRYTCILEKAQINARLRDFCFLSGFSPHERNCTTFGSFALCAF